jgi:hypothetical protein
MSKDLAMAANVVTISARAQNPRDAA